MSNRIQGVRFQPGENVFIYNDECKRVNLVECTVIDVDRTRCCVPQCDPVYVLKEKGKNTPYYHRNMSQVFKTVNEARKTQINRDKSCC